MKVGRKLKISRYYLADLCRRRQRDKSANRVTMEIEKQLLTAANKVLALKRVGLLFEMIGDDS